MEKLSVSQDIPKTLPARFDIIDILRGVAALLVVAVHLWGVTWSWNANFKREGWFFDFTYAPDIFRAVGYPITQFGWLGVSMFFAVSGFCIHYGYMRGKEGNDSISFMIRRAFRIWPAFLVSIAGVVLVLHGVLNYKGIVDYSWFDIVAHMSLLFNLFGGEQAINPVYWTLPVEFQLYVLYLLIVWIRKRVGMLKILTWVFVLEALMHMMLFWFQYEYRVSLLENIFFMSPLVYWFDWMIGAYVAERFLGGNRALPRWVLLVSLAGMILSSIWYPIVSFRYLFGATFAASIIDTCLRREFVSRVAKILSWFGTISYSLYLWHLPIIDTAVSLMLRCRVIENVPVQRFLVILVGLLIIGIPVSYLSYRYVEVPSLVFGKKVVNRWILYRRGE